VPDSTILPPRASEIKKIPEPVPEPDPKGPDDAIADVFRKLNVTPFSPWRRYQCSVSMASQPPRGMLFGYAGRCPKCQAVHAREKARCRAEDARQTERGRRGEPYDIPRERDRERESAWRSAKTYEIRISGLWGGKLCLSPACDHTAGEIIAAAGLDAGLFCNEDNDAMSLQVMPWCPEAMTVPEDKSFEWGEEELQLLRLASFLYQAPAKGSPGWTDEFQERAVELLFEVFDPWLRERAVWYAACSRKDSPLDPLSTWLKVQQTTDYCFKEKKLAPQALFQAFLARRKQARKLEEARSRAESAGLRLVEFGALPCQRPDWLVEGFLVRGQPAVFGGPIKTLKTSTALDLAISLASGEPFLGHFPVPRAARVAVFSGESGEATLVETARRIAKAKGLPDVPPGARICTRIPRLAAEGELDLLTCVLEDAGVEVVILDPLYLCLLDGAAGVASPANVFEMGPLLRRVAETCLHVGCTPVLVHHTTKAVPPGRPLQLPDLAFAGFAEFARQWCLLNTRKAFDPEAGRHRLLMSYGGSAGHTGVVALDVREGKLADDFSGRVWEVGVSSWQEARLSDHDAGVEAKGRRESQKLDRNANKLRQAFDDLRLGVGQTATLTKLRNTAGMDTKATRRALEWLESEGVVAQVAGEKFNTYRRMK
jgi:replicative DNA helicase